MEELVITKCNRLIQAKEETQHLVDENRRELAALKGDLMEIEYRWKDALEKRQESFQHEAPIYREAILEAFQTKHIPKLALSRQVELCYRMHVLAHEEEQLFLYQKQTKELAKWLERRLDHLQEEIGEVQIKYIQKIAALRNEIDYHKGAAVHDTIKRKAPSRTSTADTFDSSFVSVGSIDSLE